MGVRIRKLAREVNRSPWDVLGVLHALGYRRYKSPDDMLSGPALARLRNGLRDGVAPVPVPGRREASGTSERVAKASSDLMSQVIPGVVRQQADDRFDGIAEGRWVEFGRQHTI